MSSLSSAPASDQGTPRMNQQCSGRPGRGRDHRCVVSCHNKVWNEMLSLSDRYGDSVAALYEKQWGNTWEFSYGSNVRQYGAGSFMWIAIHGPGGLDDWGASQRRELEFLEREIRQFPGAELWKISIREYRAAARARGEGKSRRQLRDMRSACGREAPAAYLDVSIQFPEHDVRGAPAACLGGVPWLDPGTCGRTHCRSRRNGAALEASLGGGFSLDELSVGGRRNQSQRSANLHLTASLAGLV
mmetsp:Transcript_76006/g.234604  ORF Transcript_76006/g.234604 Transcript_76006/m.234604 type:complete len:244 (-) Transcript_76006:76-807(-)